MAWALEEVHPVAPVALEQTKAGGAFVPALWWFELRNGLVVNERRGRFTDLQTSRFLREDAHLAIAVDWLPDETSLLWLARHHRLTVYDAAYLELAQRKALPLATLDTALAQAARAEGVPLIGAPV
jgi:predicted nucleic acid-binding protein